MGNDSRNSHQHHLLKENIQVTYDVHDLILTVDHIYIFEINLLSLRHMVFEDFFTATSWGLGLKRVRVDFIWTWMEDHVYWLKQKYYWTSMWIMFQEGQTLYLFFIRSINFELGKKCDHLTAATNTMAFTGLFSTSKNQISTSKTNFGWSLIKMRDSETEFSESKNQFVEWNIQFVVKKV